MPGVSTPTFSSECVIIQTAAILKNTMNPMTSTRKTSRLRQLLIEKEVVVVAGAHSALSAKLVEEAGFDAVWASGFEISTLRGVPDANILTMAELLDVAKEINEPIRIPVIADCDNGFGNAINVIRTVQEYERAGIAAICIEDSIFPKRCSFYSGVKRELVSIEEHVGKIKAAKKAQADADFVVIARTEALIAGWGLEEALKRAVAYAEAGADAILIHSKSENDHEVKEFAAAWKNRCPLVAVPTTYYKTTVKELGRAGFNMVIFANHALRASIKSMRQTLRVLREAETADAVENSISTLEDVYALIGLSEMRSNEKEFLPQEEPKPKAIIVAAGFEEELMPLIQERPKGMLDIKGKTILERQVSALRECGVSDIVIVRGYKAEKINLANVRYYDNIHYQQGYILSSLFEAEQEMFHAFIFLYGDIIFDRSILEKLLQAKGDIRLIIDRAWVDQFLLTKEVALKKKPELVTTDQTPPKSHRFLPSEQLTQESHVLKIGSQLDPQQAHGEFIGMAFFSKEGARLLREVHHRAKEQFKDKPFHEAAEFQWASFADLIQEMIYQEISVTVVETYKGWMEIDTFDDYYRALASFLPSNTHSSSPISRGTEKPVIG